jgi:PAS domain-containing protein
MTSIAQPRPHTTNPVIKPDQPSVGFLRAILDAIPGPVFAKDAAGTIAFANGPMAELFNTTPTNSSDATQATSTRTSKRPSDTSKTIDT